jgi:hypothetical protein
MSRVIDARKRDIAGERDNMATLAQAVQQQTRLGRHASAAVPAYVRDYENSHSGQFIATGAVAATARCRFPWVNGQIQASLEL